MRKFGACLLALTLATAAVAQDGSMKAELADLKAKIAALESAKAGDDVTAGAPEGVVSMRKNSAVTVGGSIWLGAYTTNYDRGQPLNGATAATYADRNAKVIRSTAEANTAWLDILAKPSENTEVHMRLDLSDAWYSSPNLGQDDFLREFYVEFKDILCTGMGIKVGKMDAPTGLHWDNLLLSPYTASGSDFGFFGTSWDGNADTAGGQYNMMDYYAGKITDTFGFAYYGSMFRDMVKFESFIFQDNNTFESSTDFYNRTNPGVGNGTQNYGSPARALGYDSKTNDDMLFRSMATRMTVSPLEGLDFIFAFTNRYNGSAHNKYFWNQRAGVWTDPDSGDVYNFYNPRYTRNMQIYSGGIDWKTNFIEKLPMEFFIEYQRGENAGFRKDSRSDDIHFGTVLTLYEGLRLNLQGEWMYTHNKTYNYDDVAGKWDNQRNRYWRALAAVEYDLKRGPTLEVGWQGEWYKRYSELPGAQGTWNNFTSYGNIWYMGVKYDF